MKLSRTSKTGFKVTLCSDLLNTCPDTEVSERRRKVWKMKVVVVKVTLLMFLFCFACYLRLNASKRSVILLLEIFLL